MGLRRQISTWRLSRGATACLLLLCAGALPLSLLLPSGSSPRLPASPAAPVRSFSPIDLPDETDRSLEKGMGHVYQVELAAGEFLRGSVEQQGIDVVLTILGPGGSKLLRVDNPRGDQGRELFSVIARENGEYRLEISPYAESRSGGRYRLQIEARRPATERDRRAAEAVQLYAQAEELRRNGEDGESLRRALLYYEEALHLGDALFEPQQHTDALLGLSRVHQLLGDTRAALEAGQEALHEARKHGDLYAEAVALQRVGGLSWTLGGIEEALTSLERSGEIWSRLGRDREKASVANGLAEVYLSLGQTEEALKLAKGSLALQKASQDQAGEAETLRNLGAIYQQMGKPDLALAVLPRALELARLRHDRHGEAAVLSGLGTAYLQTGRLAEAANHYRRALELARWLGDSRAQAKALAQLGRIYDLQGEETRALDLLKQASLHYEGLGDRAALASVLHNQALAQRDEGSLVEARDSLERSVALIESLRSAPQERFLRRSFFDQRLHYYETYVDLLMELNRQRPGRGYDALAFEVSERARARTLLDDLAETPQPLSLRDIQSRLAEKDASLLVFFLGEERSFLWLVDRSSLQSRELPRRALIEAEARRAYDLLSESYRRPVRADVARSLATLSRMLLGPVATQLGKGRLLVVADGALRYIPFAALPDPLELDGTAAHGADGEPPPLLVAHEIVNLPSASILGALMQETARRPHASKQIAMFADPVFARDDPRLSARAERRPPFLAESVAERSASEGPDSVTLPRLPYSGREGEAILQLVPPGMGLKAMGFDASRQLALSPALGQYQIVHFATHGLVNDDPNRSGLVLSRFNEQGLPQDGFLRLEDVYRMRLSADLVVLSGCATALGPESRGEGLIGLTRGFMSAGSPRVLVSLWSVKDHATSELMIRFYRALLVERRSPADALRNAQISLRDNKAWRSPYYWAGFTLQGEW